MAVEVTALARAAGWPVIAEPFGAHDRGALAPHGPLLLTADQWLGRYLPERVLLVGRVTLSRAVGTLCNPAVVEQWDPSQALQKHGHCPPNIAIAEVSTET